MALCACNSGAESGRELFKDSESHLVYTQKIFFVGGFAFFVSDVISGGLLGYLGPLHLALGPNH